MITRTTEQSNRLHGLLSVLHIDTEQKAWLVEEFTEGRSSSTKDMSTTECQALIDHLAKVAVDTNADRANVMRRKAFAIAHELGWETSDGKVDRNRFDHWMLKYSYLHKGINQYTHNELPKLLTQLENITRSSSQSTQSTK